MNTLSSSFTQPSDFWPRRRGASAGGSSLHKHLSPPACLPHEPYQRYEFTLITAVVRTPSQVQNTVFDSVLKVFNLKIRDYNVSEYKKNPLGPTRAHKQT